MYVKADEQMSTEDDSKLLRRPTVSLKWLQTPPVGFPSSHTNPHPRSQKDSCAISFFPPLLSLCKCHFGTVVCDSINLVIKALQIKKSYLLKAVPAVYPHYSLLTMLVALYQKTWRGRKIAGFWQFGACTIIIIQDFIYTRKSLSIPCT